MYRNCIYNNKTKTITLFTWTSDGERVKQELDFKPYIYLESKGGADRSIYGTALKRRDFETQWDRYKFVKESGIKRIFENLPPNQQFLIDNYYHCNSDEDFNKFPLKVMFLDIETFSKDGFPDINDPQDVIQLITCYDSLSKEYTTFGLKPYDTSHITDKVVNYIHCKSEESLLKKFIEFWSDDYYDVVSGWNSSGFDIPYLVNRVSTVLNEDWQKRLSPIERIYEKFNKNAKFGEPKSEFVIEGISCVDYMVVYKKIKGTIDPQESYSLSYISEVELGESKLEYDGPLWELATNDWKTFTDYNIKDVELLVKLDEQLKYMDIIRFLSTIGLTTIDKGIITVPVINGAIAVQARKRNQKIPTFVRPKRDHKNPGAFVRDPIVGFGENMVSFDANSLYPSVMISLNLSPETKIGKFEKVDNDYIIHHVSGRQFTFTREKFAEYFKAEKLCKSKADFLFTQKTKGIVPEFLDWLYSRRKEMQKLYKKCKKDLENDKLSEVEKNELDILSKRYDSVQYSYKIALNSCYGYMGNPYAQMGDDDIASSVTLTGQSVIKKSDDLFKESMLERFPNMTDSELQNCIKYGDTDSTYISLKSSNIPLKIDGKLNPDFLELCDHIENKINTGMNMWARKNLGSIDPRFVFKRETICDSAILLKKKYYVLHIINDEGFEVDKFKYKGVSVVKTTMPKKLKPYLKMIIEDMVMNKSRESSNKLFNEAYEIFKSLPIETISRISGINTFDKYTKDCDKFKTAKGMQAHMKAAHYHNILLDELKLNSKYPKLKTGDKIRFVSVKHPNKYGIQVIGYGSKFPKEFEEIFEINYEQMFDELVFKSIKYFYIAVKWVLRKPNENVKIELEDFFS